MPRDDELSPVIPNGYLPNFNEQEVVVNLMSHNRLKRPAGEKLTSPGDLDWWARNSRGVIDPRPRIMAGIQGAADRILSHGGIFVVFADARDPQELYWAQQRGFSIVRSAEINFDNWSFLSILSRLDVEDDDGQEILLEVDRGAALGQLLAKHTRGARFSCTIDPHSSLENRWIPLANNKYGATVAGVIAPKRLRG